MRRLIGSLGLAAAGMVTAQPAMAADAPASWRDLVAATGIAPIIGLGDTPVVAPASPDFRLQATAQATDQPAATFDNQAAPLRRGFGAAMLDYFPHGTDGFHLSGGTRFYNRLTGHSGADARFADLLYAPRSSMMRATRRMTPALTFGYTKIVQRGLSLGIEGGAILGKFDTLAGALVRPPRLRGAGDGAGQLNQIARMTFGYHF
ncbi:MAG: hypothetical protein ACRYFW_13045 [Janthinobacterium lividum]